MGRYINLDGCTYDDKPLKSKIVNSNNKNLGHVIGIGWVFDAPLQNDLILQRIFTQLHRRMLINSKTIGCCLTMQDVMEIEENFRKGVYTF